MQISVRTIFRQFYFVYLRGGGKLELSYDEMDGCLNGLEKPKLPFKFRVSRKTGNTSST